MQLLAKTIITGFSNSGKTVVFNTLTGQTLEKIETQEKKASAPSRLQERYTRILSGVSSGQRP